MDLHVGYETVPEWPVACLVDGHLDEGDSDPDAYRIVMNKKMRWGKTEDGEVDRSVFEVNERTKLVGIPDKAHQYTVSGRTPLDWAIDSLRWKTDKPSQIVDDPNGWYAWSDEPFNLIRHLRRLIYVSVETAVVVENLPPALAD